MASPHPAVAAIRAALGRVDLRSLCRHEPGSTADPVAPVVLVACSGGADSLALATAAAFLAPRRGWRAGLVTVDHGLQPGSAQVADRVADWARAEGFDPVGVERVLVGGQSGGPEAAARTARYAALVRFARSAGAGWVLLGHTREDQAETVLLALLRGAGLRGLAGMPAVRDLDGVRFLRPLLGVSRGQTQAACAALGLTPWVDPHNGDPAYARSRARAQLAALAAELGPAVVDNLARTAAHAAAAAQALDELAGAALARLCDPDQRLQVDGLAELPAAVRARTLHRWARTLGVSGSALSQRHVGALDALVMGWHGQGPVHLPGAVMISRRDGMLRREAVR